MSSSPAVIQHNLGVLLTLLVTEKSLDVTHTHLLRKSGHSPPYCARRLRPERHRVSTFGKVVMQTTVGRLAATIGAQPPRQRRFSVLLTLVASGKNA